MGLASLETLREGAAHFGIELTDAQIAQFGHFALLLEDWNARINLTRVPPEEYVSLHFLDSLAVLSAVEIPVGAACIDVGTGAGFPGLPLKIVRPDLKMTLLDATAKKLRFLDAVIADLGLENCTTVHSRAEEAAHMSEHKARYGFALARAVAPMDRLAGWLMPFVKPSGMAVCLKGPGIDEELASAAATLQRGRIEWRVRNVDIPGVDLDRRIVLLRRTLSSKSP